MGLVRHPPIAGNWLVREPPASGPTLGPIHSGSGATVHNHLAGSERTSCGEFSQRTHFRLQAASSSFWMLRSAAIIPKALLADLWGFPIMGGRIEVARRICAMPSAVRLREDYSVQELRALARRSKDVNQSDGFCLWPRSGMEWTAERRRRSAEHRHQPIEEARACSACLIERTSNLRTLGPSDFSDRQYHGEGSARMFVQRWTLRHIRLR